MIISLFPGHSRSYNQLISVHVWEVESGTEMQILSSWYNCREGVSKVGDTELLLKVTSDV